MVVETQSVQFESLSLDSGVELRNVDCAYETYGALNAAKIQRHPGRCTPSPATRTRPASATKPASRAGGTT